MKRPLTSIQNQRFLFLFVVLLLLALASGSKFEEDDNLTPTTELHKALSTSDGVNGSPSELSS